MMTDITFGQFFPLDSVLHKLDSRIKLVLTFGLITLIFCAFNFYSLILVSLFTIFAMILSKVPVKIYFKSMKSIAILVVITSLLNMFYNKEGNLLFGYGIFEVYSGGVYRAIFFAIRIIFLIIISSILTYTTSPTSLSDAIQSLLKPIDKLGVDTHTFAMMLTIALRFIPTLIEDTGKIMNAQKARGANFESGNMLKRIKAILPILIPLLASSVRRAVELAHAMESRAYHGGKGRTRLNVMKTTRNDYFAVGFCLVLVAGLVALNIYF